MTTTVNGAMNFFRLNEKNRSSVHRNAGTKVCIVFAKFLFLDALLMDRDY